MSDDDFKFFVFVQELHMDNFYKCIDDALALILSASPEALIAIVAVIGFITLSFVVNKITRLIEK